MAAGSGKASTSVAATVVALVLTASACGGDARPSAVDVEAVSVLVDAERSLDEQRCVLDGLQGLAVTPARILNGDLTPDEEALALDVSLECVDDLSSIETFVDSFIEAAADAGTTLSPDQARCTIRALDEIDQDAAILACLVAGSSETDSEVPVLDLLAEQCRRGSNQACDELFIDAPEGSAYETYGQTCANRLPDGNGLNCFDVLG